MNVSRYTVLTTEMQLDDNWEFGSPYEGDSLTPHFHFSCGKCVQGNDCNQEGKSPALH